MGNKIAYILLGLAVLSIFQTVVIAQPVIEQGSLLTPQLIDISPQASAIEYIIADHSHHHLGDDFKIYINDIEVGILNLHVPPVLPPPKESADIPEELATTSEFRTLLDSDRLKKDNNTIKITSGSKEDGSNYDDFEFFNLELKGIRKNGWVLSGRVEIDNEPATYARVYVYRHGTVDEIASSRTDNNGSYSIKLSNGVYDVKAVSYAEFSPLFETKSVVIDNSNVTLDFVEASMFGSSQFQLLLFFIFFIFPSLVVALFIAITVYKFTKKRKSTVIGFVLGIVTTCVMNLLMWATKLAQLLEEGSLLLSAGIAFIIVAVPIILLNKRQSKVEGGGELL